jgi:hypothetical protein
LKNASASPHPELARVQALVHQPAGLTLTDLQVEAESAEYGAARFMLDGRAVRFRVARITPTKTGQFVTLWKRIDGGGIQPFDAADIDQLFVVTVRKGEDFGHFVFPKAALRRHDVIAQDGRGGKRAMRVYPPWDRPASRQAERSQQWQATYFLAIPGDGRIDTARAASLYAA